MRFSILGPTEFSIEGRNIPLGPAKQRGMLAVLLYHVGESVRVETLVEFLWHGRDVESCRPLLYSLASRLRAVLRGGGLDNALIRIPGTGAYRLNVDPELIDYHRFRRLTREAREAVGRNQHDHCVALLGPAIEMWRGDPLADLRGARGEHLRRHLQDILLGTAKLLAESELAIGQHNRVFARLEPLLAEEQFDEGLARLWASALHAAGRTHDAQEFVRTFRRRYRRRMRSDPALEPGEFLPHGPARSLAPDRAAASAASAVTADAGRTDGAGAPTLPAAANSVVGIGVAGNTIAGNGTTLNSVAGNGVAGSSAAGTGDPGTEPRWRLPNGVPDFTGRSGLLAELDAFASGGGGAANVTVLAGMPGVGKTTLVIHWGQNRRDRFPDGQLYLDVEAYGPAPPVRPEEAVRRLLVALGVTPDRMPTDVEQRRELYHRLLTDRRMLIVLDNVLDSDQALQMLPRSGTCLTVITSRNRLPGLSVRHGIRNITVTPLPDDERQHLLGRIIGAERAEEEPGALRTLGELSGGLPLALRVMGEHVASRPRARLSHLADELSSRLLDIEGDDTGEATLRTVFAWSVNALEPLPARMFRALGVFPGTTIGVEAAAVLLDTDADQAGRALDRLARAHLVNHDTVRRYRTHDLLRRYAADLAQAEELPEQRRDSLHRLVDWYLLSAVNAVRLLEPQQHSVPDLPRSTMVTPARFESEGDALRWCEAERANLLPLVRAADAAGFHRHAWQTVDTLHEILDRSGGRDDLRELLRVALGAANADGHTVGRVGTLINLGATYAVAHEYGRAAEIFTQALRLSRKHGFVEPQLICLNNLATFHLRNGELTAAIETFEQVLTATRETGHPVGEATSLGHLGEANRRLGQHAKARRYYEEALAVCERVGSLRGRSLNHVRLAELNLDTDRAEAALAQARAALDLHDRVTDEVIRCDALIVAAEAELRLDQHRAAMADGSLARVVAEELADKLRRGRAFAVLVDALAATGDRPGATALRREALDFLGTPTDPGTRVVVDRLLTATGTNQTADRR